MSEGSKLTPNDIVVLELCKILDKTGDFLRQTNARNEILMSLFEPSDDFKKECSEMKEKYMDEAKKFEELLARMNAAPEVDRSHASASVAPQLAIAMDQEPVQDEIEIPVHKGEEEVSKKEGTSEKDRNEPLV
ncbi:hypothetical protein GCK72_023631 [Caenorhabditis remanei]|uniref:Uncharacterized protein n=1 Tax=Caenorhabditis remanei TaxID=31234 RepID=E3M241_CAERE|nr:hypothetical protein GCK72_023631 [Caenorhabditis remanei]EFO89726.1 hypothetical protein CRE_07420 [Caenorhabditis remanei]KAF1747170.1 hypothetical protein GCK72_023631 [Caenorhabditis remanei]